MNNQVNKKEHVAEIKVLKKDGTVEAFNKEKIINAVNKSADRALVKFTDWDLEAIVSIVENQIRERDLEVNGVVEVRELHKCVEYALERVDTNVAKSYKDYRNYKVEFIHMMDDVYKQSQKIRYIGDKDNANTDSALVATKRSLIFNSLNKSLYQKFFMTTEELQACKDGYIYVHDMSARLDTINCCLFKVGEVMKNGFEMGNLWYNEPNSLDVAFDVMGDIILSTAAQQYGGFTVPRVDSILAPYAEKSFEKYKEEYMEIIKDTGSWRSEYEIYFDNGSVVSVPSSTQNYKELAAEYARNKVKRDFEQGWQGIEYKLNSVGSSRGDYPEQLGHSAVMC